MEIYESIPVYMGFDLPMLQAIFMPYKPYNEQKKGDPEHCIAGWRGRRAFRRMERLQDF